jgi:hypothetical protein
MIPRVEPEGRLFLKAASHPWIKSRDMLFGFML